MKCLENVIGEELCTIVQIYCGCSAPKKDFVIRSIAKHRKGQTSKGE